MDIDAIYNSKRVKINDVDRTDSGLIREVYYIPPDFSNAAKPSEGGSRFYFWRVGDDSADVLFIPFYDNYDYENYYYIANFSVDGIPSYFEIIYGEAEDGVEKVLAVYERGSRLQGNLDNTSLIASNYTSSIYRVKKINTKWQLT